MIFRYALTIVTSLVMLQFKIWCGIWIGCLSAWIIITFTDKGSIKTNLIWYQPHIFHVYNQLICLLKISFCRVRVDQRAIMENIWSMTFILHLLKIFLCFFTLIIWSTDIKKYPIGDTVHGQSIILELLN